MSLDQKTLELLTAKDSQIEAQWYDNETILYLEAAARFWKIRFSPEAPPEGLTFSPSYSELSVGSSLPYAGQFVALKNRLLVLESSHTIHDITHEKTWDSGGPSTDLNLDAKDQAVWVVHDESLGIDSLVRRSMSASIEILTTSPHYLRHVQCHPIDDRFIFLTWARDSLPWHSAELMLLSYDAAGGGYKSVAIYPPGLERHPCAEACFSPAGDTLAASFLTGDYFQLWIYKVKSELWIQLSFEEREHSTPLRRSSRRTLAFLNEKRIVCTSSHKAYWDLMTTDFNGRSQIIATPMTHLQNIQVNRDSQEILALGSGLHHPPQILRVKLEGPSWKSRTDGERLRTRIKAEPMTWATKTGETVHGILYRDAHAKGPSPLILPVHGGPTDAVHAAWPSKALAFVQKGYAVLYINYRGSWGYGYAYHQALAGRWGELEIEDCVSGVKSLAASGWIDPNRVGLWGGASASYTVLWALIRHPEIFHAGVAVFPMLDLVHHFANCSLAERTELIWALGSGEPDSLAARSPLSAMAQLRRPLGLFAGRLDPLIQVNQLEEVAAAMKEARIPCWLSLYENESRSWRSHATYVDYYSKVAGFFDRFLRFKGND